MIRSIDLNDLLPRRSVVRDRTAVSQMLDGKRIVVTGAGGSIGSELARQINQYKPRELVLVDNCEFNLYSISEQIPTAKAVYADIRDSDSVNTFMRSNLEQVVFHAIASLGITPLTGTKSEAHMCVTCEV